MTPCHMQPPPSTLGVFSTVSKRHDNRPKGGCDEQSINVVVNVVVPDVNQVSRADSGAAIS